MYVDLAQYDQSLECYQKAVDIFRIFKFKEGETGCLNGIGVVCRDRGDYKNAFDCFERSLAINEANNNQQDIGTSHSFLASAYMAIEKYEKAIAHANKSIKIFMLSGDLHEERSCLSTVGEAHRHQGKFKKSIAFQNKALCR